MYNVRLKKIAGVLAVAMALTAMPLSANAAADTPAPATAPNKEVNLGGNADGTFTEDADPTRKGIDPGHVSATGVALDVTGDAIDGNSVNTDIAVWGYTEDATVYSVDVEWGAMTFQYENSSWDPETHKAKEGAGWGVYDAVNEKRLGDVQDDINQITIINHSNAPVYAGLAYTADKTVEDYSDITGEFESSDPGYDRTTDYVSLETADNGRGADGAGRPTTAHVYFKPVGLSDDHKTSGITQWTKIGVITVSLQTTDPAAAPDAP